MTKIILKLEFLDRLNRLSYSNPVFVCHNSDPDRLLGVCEIKLQDGKHTGEFSFTAAPTLDWFLYYNEKPIYDDVYNLDIIGLHDVLRSDIPTKSIRDLII